MFNTLSRYKVCLWASPEAHVLPRLDVDRLVDSGHVAEGGGLVQGRGGRRLQRTQAREVVHLRGKVGEGLGVPDLV